MIMNNVIAFPGVVLTQPEPKRPPPWADLVPGGETGEDYAKDCLRGNVYALAWLRFVLNPDAQDYGWHQDWLCTVVGEMVERGDAERTKGLRVGFLSILADFVAELTEARRLTPGDLDAWARRWLRDNKL
jgi:hypothetical protein